MALSNTKQSYGSVTKTFHWLSALLILSLFPLGIIANEMPFETSAELEAKARMFSIHKTLGVAVFFVALARIIWAIAQPKPGLLHPDRKAETLAAETVHWLLYGSLVLVPLSGWIHHAATDGFAPIWWPFGQNLPLVPKSEPLAGLMGGAHWVLTKVMGAALLLHIAGALKHHVIDKDATLRRMWFGQTQTPISDHVHSHVAPVLIAVSLWIAALAAGSAIGIYKPHGESTLEVAELAEVQSDWQVQDGTLSIEVLQLGSPVTGTFADWTAAITFDQSIQDGVAGTVDVTVAIASLTLGSVTKDALGADYFDAVTFPTATFQADIHPMENGTYEARGTLTIRNQTLPVVLPFQLTLDGNTAAMTGALTLDRRNYGVGSNMTDGGTVGFPVNVNVDLTASLGSE